MFRFVYVIKITNFNPTSPPSSSPHVRLPTIPTCFWRSQCFSTFSFSPYWRVITEPWANHSYISQLHQNTVSWCGQHVLVQCTPPVLTPGYDRLNSKWN